jgi:hypothetical protein
MVVSSPAVANGIVYVGSYDHLVYAFGPPHIIPTIPELPSLIVLSLFIVTILLAALLLAVALYRRKH